MNMISRTAIGLVLALGLASGAAVSPALAKKDKSESSAPKYKFSKAVQKLLGEAQKAQQEGDHATALAKLDEAEAAASTPDDSYMANALKINSGIALKDDALIEKALSKSLESERVTGTERLNFQRNIVAMASKRGDHVRALAVYEQMAAENPSDGEIAVGLGEMYNHAGQVAKGVATIRKAIDLQQAAGEAVPESWFKRGLALAYGAKLTKETTLTSLMLVKAYPGPTNWRDALVIFREGGGLDDQGNLDVMRLMREAKALKGERDYVEYAETANLRGVPGEAKAVLDEGIAKGEINASKTYVKELVNIVSGKLRGDKGSLGGLEREARGAKNGKLAKATADGYLSYGENAKAAELYRLALGKGGVDAAEVNTRLGMALTRSGDRAGATAAFKAVQGGKRQALAEFWLAYLDQKSAPAPAPAPAPAAASAPAPSEG